MNESQHWQPWRHEELPEVEPIRPAPPTSSVTPTVAARPTGQALIRQRSSAGWAKTLVPASPGLLLTLFLWIALIFVLFHAQPLLALAAVWAGLGWVGACYYLQRTNGGKVVLARFMFGFARPSPAEESLISAEWASVCARADVSPEECTLWVQRTPEVNAFAAGGDFVGVTTGALGLPPAYLQAVLAHEYGHHSRGHVEWAIYTWWCALPGAKLLGFVNRVLARHTAVSLVYVLVVMPIVVLIALASIVGIILIPILVAPVMWVVSAYLSRQAELEADQVALDLGYGLDLIAALQWIDARSPQHSEQSWSSSHPSVGQRIAALTGSPVGSTLPSETEPQAAAAGWYPDGASAARLRWWDGRQWADHFHPH